MTTEASHEPFKNYFYTENAYASNWWIAQIMPQEEKEINSRLNVDIFEMGPQLRFMALQ